MLAIIYTELFRRIPFLVTLLLVFFASQALQLDISLFTVALVSVCLIATAFLAEIIRGGLESVHRAQWDAAEVMNLPSILTLRHVIFPQAWKVILPPAFSFLHPVHQGYRAGLPDRRLGAHLRGQDPRRQRIPAVLVFGTVLVLYFAMSYPLARLGAYLEVRLCTSSKCAELMRPTGANPSSRA